MAAAGPDLPIEGKTVRTMVTQLAKRGRIAFQDGVVNEEDEKAVLRGRCALVSPLACCQLHRLHSAAEKSGHSERCC